MILELPKDVEAALAFHAAFRASAVHKVLQRPWNPCPDDIALMQELRKNS